MAVARNGDVEIDFDEIIDKVLVLYGHPVPVDMQKDLRSVDLLLRNVLGETGFAVSMHKQTNPRQTQGRCTVTVDNDVSARKLVNELNGSGFEGLGCGAIKVEMKKEWKTMLNQEAHDVLCVCLDDRLRVIRRMASIMYADKRLKGNRYEVKVAGTFIDSLKHAVSQIEQLLTPHVVNHHNRTAFRQLFEEGCQNWLRQLSNVYVCLDRRSASVQIFGNPLDRSRAAFQIDNFLNTLGNAPVERISLVTTKFSRAAEWKPPPGLLCAMVRRFGIDFEILRRETGARNVRLDWYRKQLVLHEDDPAVAETVRQVVRGVADELSPTKCVADPLSSLSKLSTMSTQCQQLNLAPEFCTVGPTPIVEFKSIFECDVDLDDLVPQEEPEDETVDCAACLTPIEDRHDQVYFLQYCGHPYCMECIYTQIRVACMDRHFPIVCAHCQNPFLLEDFNQLFPDASEITRSTIECFIRRNPTQYQFCPTAECRGFYRIMKRCAATDGPASLGGTQSSVYQCWNCQTRVCRLCSRKAHDDLHCDNDGESSWRVWAQSVQADAKACRRCTQPLEKNGGCNHILCPCGAHICWICSDVFENAETCYAHLGQQHNDNPLDFVLPLLF